MPLQPALVLLVRVAIIQDDVQLAVRESGDKAVHEAEKLDAAPPFRMLRNDPPAGYVKRCKQGRGAMQLVVMALARQGAPVRELQIPLCPLQGLDRRFFIDTDNNRLGRRINIETHNIGSFRRELRVVTLAPGLAGGQIDVVLSQETPNILNINIPQRLGQQRTRPSGIALRWRLIQKRQNAPVSRRTVDRLLVRARAVL